MATPYPKVTAKAWGALQARAASAPTTKFTPSIVAPLLGLSSPRSARDNTVTPLRRLGLIDDDGALTDRGNKWRVDSSYANACQEILDDVYPNELASLTAQDGSPDAQQVRTWFDHQGFGESNARQMAATYVMIASKEISEAQNAGSGDTKRAAPRKPVTKEPAKAKKAEESASAKRAAPPTPPADSGRGPAVHIDLQIHIPVDSSAEQIDQIFASMAKHLYPK